MNSVGGSSTRRRTSRMMTPAASPTSRPPTPLQMNFKPASASEKLPLTTAATATLYRTSAVQSLVRFSPSITASMRCGAPIRRRISAGATASVGETTAPSTNASAQPRPIAWWATKATASIVARTTPIESRAIGRALRRRSRSDVKNAAP